MLRPRFVNSYIWTFWTLSILYTKYSQFTFCQFLCFLPLLVVLLFVKATYFTKHVHHRSHKAVLVSHRNVGHWLNIIIQLVIVTKCDVSWLVQSIKYNPWYISTVYLIGRWQESNSTNANSRTASIQKPAHGSRH